MRLTHKHMLREFKSAEHAHQNSVKRNSERNKQKKHLLECFRSCPQRFNSAFFRMHTKNIYSKFSADERFQIDSPRD